MLGPWLESLYIPVDVKSTIKEIFKDHCYYRAKYNPVNGSETCDLMFMYAWPEVGRLICDLVEQCVYTDNPNTEAMIRLYARQGKDAPESLLQHPFKQWVQDIMDKVKPPAATGSATAGDNDTEGKAKDADGTDGNNDDDEHEDHEEEKQEKRKQIIMAVERFIGRNMHLVVEPPSQAALSELMVVVPVVSKGTRRP